MQLRINIFVFILILILICSLTFLFMDFMFYFNGNYNIDDFNNKYKYPNKKIAICYSGQIRKGYYQVLNMHKLFLIDPLNADVFCYFDDIDNIDNKDSNTIKNDIQKLLKPKKIFYENIDKNQPEYINNILYCTVSMYKKMYYSNQLRKEYETLTNTKYDYVVRIRPDLIIKKYLPPKIFYETNDKNLYIPTDIHNETSDNSDWMAIGTNKCMDSYFDIYNYIINNKKNKCNISEKLLHIHLQKEKINVTYLFNYTEYPIVIYRNKFDSFDNFIETFKYYHEVSKRYTNENKNICEKQLKLEN